MAFGSRRLLRPDPGHDVLEGLPLERHAAASATRTSQYYAAQLAWLPTRDFEIGVELAYARVSQDVRGYTGGFSAGVAGDSSGLRHDSVVKPDGRQLDRSSARRAQLLIWIEHPYRVTTGGLRAARFRLRSM